MKQKMKNGQKLIIAVLLIILITAVVLGLYAWARYTSSTPGETSMKVAKWHFDLTNTEGTSLSETGPIDLAETLDFEHVASDRIAPGTYGQFEMVVDTTGTEVDLLYEIEVALTNCPTNLNFYTDASHTNLISKSGDKLTFAEYLTHTQAINYKETISIYWNWPYETLDSNNSSAAGDAQDNLDNGKTVTMNITARGTEMLSAPVTVGTIKNGETIITNGSTIILEVGDTTTLSVTGSEEVTYSSNNTSVATVNETTGVVEAIAQGNAVITITGKDSGKTVTVNIEVIDPIVTAAEALVIENNISKFVNYTDGNGNTILCNVLYNDSTHGLQIISSGAADQVNLGYLDENYKDNNNSNVEKSQNSYNNAIENLNNKAESYINSDLAVDARCVGSVATVTNGVFLNKDDEVLLTNPNNYSYLDTYTTLGCKGEDTHYEEDYDQMGTLNIRDGIYWLASHHVYSDAGNTTFDVRYMERDYLNYSYIWLVGSNGTPYATNYSHDFRPVFLLKSNVKVTGGSGQQSDPYTIAAY